MVLCRFPQAASKRHRCPAGRIRRGLRVPSRSASALRVLTLAPGGRRRRRGVRCLRPRPERVPAHRHEPAGLSHSREPSRGDRLRRRTEKRAQRGASWPPASVTGRSLHVCAATWRRRGTWCPMRTWQHSPSSRVASGSPPTAISRASRACAGATRWTEARRAQPKRRSASRARPPKPRVRARRCRSGTGSAGSASLRAAFIAWRAGLNGNRAETTRMTS